MSSSESDFDDMIELLGGFGKYQKRLLYALLGPLCLIMPFPLLHQVFVLHSPPYTCMIPASLNNTSLGLSFNTWQEIVFKKELNAYYINASDHCSYYDLDDSQISTIKGRAAELEAMNPENLTSFAAEIQSSMNRTECSAWNYDQTEFWDTAVTENNWICDKALYAADFYTLSTVGMVLGIFIFSAIADYFGRKTGFYAGLACVIVFSLCQIPVSYSFALFGFFKVFATFGMLPIFQSPLSILSEISNVDNRGYVLCYACLTWSLGQIFFPLVGWLIASWKILKAISVLPLVFFFFAWNYLPESPRWMISKGKGAGATKILREIAAYNGVTAPQDLDSRVEKLVSATKEKTFGYASLFSSRQLTIKTIVMTLGMTASAFVYYQMVINVSNMMGNTFLNLFLLGLVEGPGNVLGFVLSNKFGRRWTHCVLLVVNSIFFGIITPLVYYPETAWAGPMISVLCMCIKMNIAATFLIGYIQAMELFPTPIRASGLGFCSIISQIISIGGPYIIALGIFDIKIPYLVMCCVCLVGSLAVSFLPETVGAKLPETLQDAANFGAKDAYFSFRPTRYEAPAAQDKMDRI